jgi:hypothetical protein
MKQLFISLLGGLGLVCCLQPEAKAQRQEFKEHLSKEFALPKGMNGVLALYNLRGALDVQGYDGDKVVIEIDEVISAKDTEKLEAGKREFKLAFQQTNDSILVYIAEPYDSRPHRGWQDGDENKRIEYEYRLEFTVKVPYHMNLDISTVMNGGITVKDVTGALRVNNVNGPVVIRNAKGTTEARTINGNLTVNYAEVPPGESIYYTMNGTLEVTYPASLSADLQFKSMNGGFYTDFPNMEILPVRVIKHVEKDGSATRYRLSMDKQVRIGDGGKLFRFETLNGNIYIKKQA